MIEAKVGKIEFVADLEKYAKSVKRTYITALKWTVKWLSDEIIKRSPHDKGNFIASNRISFNFVDNSVYTGPKMTKGAAKAAAKRQQDKIKNLDQSVLDNLTTIWLSNNVPYAQMLEYGLYPYPGPKLIGGYSKQAPKGIYRLSVQAAEDRLKEFIKKAEIKEGIS